MIGKSWNSINRRIKRRKELRDTEQMAAATDPCENAEVLLPENEQVQWQCLWLAEIYAPSHADALAKGVARLEKADTSFFRQEKVAESLGKTRMWTGGFHELGQFSNERSRGALPQEFKEARARLNQIAPGITAVVVQFVLAERHVSCLEEVMRQSFSTKALPLPGRPGGQRIYGPELRKAKQLSEVRSRFHRAAQDWLADIAPGLFADLPHAEVPAWDMILSNQSSLYDSRSTPADRWRDVLGYERAMERWESSELPGLLLALPQNRDNAAPALLGKTHEAMEILKDAHAGSSVSSLVYVVGRKVADQWAIWALRSALDAHAEVFSAVRDELGAAPQRFSSGRRLRKLREDVMPLAFDLQALREAAENKKALAMPIRYSGTEFTPVKYESNGQVINWSEGETLLTEMSAQIRRDGQKVAAQGRDISEALRVQGELLLAMTNVRLQLGVLALTVVVGIASVLATLNAN